MIYVATLYTKATEQPRSVRVNKILGGQILFCRKIWLRGSEAWVPGKIFEFSHLKCNFLHSEARRYNKV